MMTTFKVLRQLFHYVKQFTGGSTGTSSMRMTDVSYSSVSTVMDSVTKSQTTSENYSTSSPGRKIKQFLVVGLGNHGFPNTRHSVGMRAVDRLAFKIGANWEQSSKNFSGFICQAKVRKNGNEIRLVLFKPKALMNINGVSVAKAATQLSVVPHDIILIHDELDKSLGKFHLKEGGSTGGHNGVLSCLNSLKSNEMMRLRIGISRPATKLLVVPYVLSNFSEAELSTVDVAIDQGIDMLLDHLERRTSEGFVDMKEKCGSNKVKHHKKLQMEKVVAAGVQKSGIETECPGISHSRASILTHSPQETSHTNNQRQDTYIDFNSACSKREVYTTAKPKDTKPDSLDSNGSLVDR